MDVGDHCDHSSGSFIYVPQNVTWIFNQKCANTSGLKAKTVRLSTLNKMRDRDKPPHSTKRLYMLTSNSLKSTTLAFDQSDAEQIVSGLIPSLDRIQNDNNNMVIQEEPSLTFRSININETLHISPTQEKASTFHQHGLSSCRIPCTGTLLKILIMYGLIATGIGGYLFRQFFRIPSMQNEVNQLSKQVDRLQVEIIALKYVFQS